MGSWPMSRRASTAARRRERSSVMTASSEADGAPSRWSGRRSVFASGPPSRADHAQVLITLLEQLDDPMDQEGVIDVGVCHRTVLVAMSDAFGDHRHPPRGEAAVVADVLDIRSGQLHITPEHEVPVGEATGPRR